jgi:signal transduction histidine kinase
VWQRDEIGSLDLEFSHQVDSTTSVLPMRENLLEVPESLHFEYRELLSKTAHLLLRDGEVDELCLTIFEILRQPLKLDVYFHYLVSDDQARLELASSGGNDVVRAALGSPLSFGEAVCGTVAERCEWMYVPQVQGRNDQMTRLIRSFGIRCYACQPLLSKGRLLGTFSFGSCRRDEFTAEEIEVFRVVAEQVTLATERRFQNKYIRQLEYEAAAGRMCATIAHEINNPLETLTNLLYLLRDDVDSQSGRELLKTAEGDVTRLAATTRRILDLFRGRQQNAEPMDVSRLLREVLSGLRVPRQIPIEPALQDDLYVHANPGELRQVFVNLLINAAQFSPADKKVSLTASRNDAAVEVRVRDEGPGISEKNSKKLFQPYFTTRVGSGTGLGLWVSQEIVNRYGGSLTFVSNPTVGPGTDFVVTLPMLDMTSQSLVS